MAVPCPLFDPVYGWYIMVPGPNGLELERIRSPLFYFYKLGIDPPIGAVFTAQDFETFETHKLAEETLNATAPPSPNASIAEQAQYYLLLIKTTHVAKPDKILGPWLPPENDTVVLPKQESDCLSEKWPIYKPKSPKKSTLYCVYKENNLLPKPYPAHKSNSTPAGNQSLKISSGADQQKLKPLDNEMSFVNSWESPGPSVSKFSLQMNTSSTSSSFSSGSAGLNPCSPPPVTPIPHSIPLVEASSVSMIAKPDTNSTETSSSLIKQMNHKIPNLSPELSEDEYDVSMLSMHDIPYKLLSYSGSSTKTLKSSKEEEETTL